MVAMRVSSCALAALASATVPSNVVANSFAVIVMWFSPSDFVRILNAYPTAYPG
jgi:hypothetical protein